MAVRREQGDRERHFYCQERFAAQRALGRRVAHTLEVNEILEIIRAELRRLIPTAMEACILILDPEAKGYTRPLQCALYERPVNCLACKRNRPAIQKAISQRKGVVVPRSGPIRRHDGSKVTIGPEAAVPVMDGDRPLAVVSVVTRPGVRFTRKDFYFLMDVSETLTNILLNAKRHWQTSQEKIRISQMLAHLTPFVPRSVRTLVEKDPQLLNQEKQERDVTVLFLDLEGYTRLSAQRPEKEINALVERTFSSFVDPIHRSHGDINETAGDSLMILFKDHDPKTNAVHAVKAALDIQDRNRELNHSLPSGIDPINVNMGINSGIALLGMTRLEGLLQTRMTYTATGPVTNLAARLASYAEGGDILIGETTLHLIEGLWPVYDRGEVYLKGLDQPIGVYSLVRPGPGAQDPPAFTAQKG